MAMLKAARFITSIRGSKGGYILARAANDIQVGDLFNALEGPNTTVECRENESYCDRIANCVIRQLWQDVQKAIHSVLFATTLQDLVDRTVDEDTLSYQI